jgi:hypothetical protein
MGRFAPRTCGAELYVIDPGDGVPRAANRSVRLPCAAVNDHTDDCRNSHSDALFRTLTRYPACIASCLEGSMRQYTPVVVLTILLAVSVPSAAAPRAGDWEIGLDGGTFLSDLRKDLDIRGSVGFFPLGYLEIGISGGWSRERWKGDLDEDIIREPHDAVGSIFDIGRLDHETTWWDVSLFAKAHLDTRSPATPYVGGFVGYEGGRLEAPGLQRYPTTRFDHELETFRYGLLAGVKLWLNDRTAVFGELAHTWRDDPRWSSRGRLPTWAKNSTGEQTISIGLVHLLGPTPDEGSADSPPPSATPDMSAGRWEATVSGDLQLSRFQEAGGLRVSLATFLHRGLSIGAAFAYRAHTLDGGLDDDYGTEYPTGSIDSESRASEANLFVTYHLPTAGRWTPYVGASVGYEWATLETNGVGFNRIRNADFERHGVQCGLHVGVNHWLTGSTSIYLEYRGTYRRRDWFDGSDTRGHFIDDDIWVDDDSFAHGLGFGISFLFG